MLLLQGDVELESHPGRIGKQRGNGSTAVAGTVASAIRYLAKLMFVGSPNFGRTGQARQDVGEPTISEFLEGIPGVTKATGCCPTCGQVLPVTTAD